MHGICDHGPIATSLLLIDPNHIWLGIFDRHATCVLCIYFGDLDTAWQKDIASERQHTIIECKWDLAVLVHVECKVGRQQKYSVNAEDL